MFSARKAKEFLMELWDYLYFLGTAILLTLAPGPDNMYVLTKSLSSGAKQGVTLACGLAAGPIFHTTLVMVGVAAFIQSSPAAFRILTLCGAAYLLYLSFSAFRSGGAAIDTEGKTDSVRSFALWRRGFLMNASNPKVLLFFLALLPQFVRTDAPLPPSLQIALMGLSFAVITVCLFSLIALCAGKMREFLLTYKRFPLIMSRVEGTVLLLIAAGLLFL